MSQWFHFDVDNVIDPDAYSIELPRIRTSIRTVLFVPFIRISIFELRQYLQRTRS